MHTKKYTFYFKSGLITVRATSADRAKILAQAQAIENGWDYTIMANVKLEKLDMHINWCLLSEEEQVTLHTLLSKAKVTVQEG